MALAQVGAGLLLLVAGRWAARRWPRAAAGLTVALPLAVLAAAWAPALGVPARTPPAPSPATAPTGPDILVVTLDTFRADHLGVMGGGADTPHLDALAAQGALYTQAVTTVPLTAPAHASMWTGLPVTRHGLRANGMRLEADSVVPRLRAAGWRTGAFVSAHVIDHDTGLDAGFQHYDDRWGWGQRLLWIPLSRWLDLDRRSVVRRGDETVERARAWLAEGPGPRLAWVHLYDAHAPYRPPRDWWPPDDALREARRKDKASMRRQPSTRGLAELLSHGRVEHELLMYAAGIRWVDHLVGELLEGLDPDTVVVVVGDHGESLTEHDYFFNHGARLWEPSTHVPFIVRWAGRVPAGSREDGLVSVQAVAPLVLAAAGLDGGGLPTPVEAVEQVTTGQQARQIGAFRHRDRPRGPQLSTRQSAAVRIDGGKVVDHLGEGPTWYDLLTDPAETAPRPVPEALESTGLRVEELMRLEPPRLDDEQIERLEALGYVDAQK